MKNLFILLLCISALAGCTKDDFLQDQRSRFTGRYQFTVRHTHENTVTNELLLDSTYDCFGTVSYGSNVKSMLIRYSGNLSVEPFVYKDGMLMLEESNTEFYGEFYENTLEMQVDYFTPGERHMYYVTGKNLE